MIYAVFNEQGFPIGFYSREVHGNNIPDGAVEISDAEWHELLDNPATRRWVDGEIVVVEPPTTPSAIIDYENAIQNLVDSTAREKQFRDGVTLASYIGSTIPKWAEEAQAFAAWRDSVWLYAYAELEKVQNGERQQPTVEEILDELPKITWPPT